MLTIREVTARTGLTPHTLRYYERIGLIDAVARGGSGQRRYRDDDLRWIEFLLRLRSTGMGIADMQRYAALRRAGDTPDSVTGRRALMQGHAAQVEDEIARLSGHLAVLRDKIAIYQRMERQFDDAPALPG